MMRIGTRRTVMIVAVLVASVWAAVASAGAPRLLALGGDGTYLEDTRGVLRWYGSLVDHPNLVTLESGLFDGYGYYSPFHHFRMSGPTLGVHVALGGERPAAVVGLWLAESGNDTEPGTLVEDRLETTGTILVAHDFGGVSGGVIWRHGSAEENGDFYALSGYGTAARDVTRDDLGLGVRIDLGSDAYLDLAGEWRGVTVRSVRTPDGGSPVDSGDLESSTNGALRARAFVALNPTMVLVPAAEYTREDRPVASAAGMSELVDGWVVRLGCGFMWLPDPDRMVLLTADFRKRDSDHRYEAPDYDRLVRIDSPVFAVRAATEMRAGAFWSLRAALGFEWSERTTTELLDGGVSTRDSDFLMPMSLGLALHAGRWDLDLGVASDPPAGLDGTHFYSSDSTWLNIGLTYSF